MITNAYQYYNNLQAASNSVDEAIAQTLSKMTDEFDINTDYSSIMISLTNFKRDIIRMQNVNKFLRLSISGFVQQSELQSTKQIEILHTVKDYETPFSIAQLYNVNLSDILRKNNILTSDITAGLQLNIDIAQSQALNKVFDNIPSYGPQDGDLVLGIDLPNLLTATAAGDLQYLDPEDTLAQGIANRIYTKQGDYPLNNNFGLSPIVGSEIPDDLISGMYLTQLQNIIEQDPRIASVDSLNIVRSGNSVTFSGQATSINNKQLSIN